MDLSERRFTCSCQKGKYCFRLKNTAHTVFECRQGCLGTFSHGDNNLFVSHIGNISCRINTRNRGTTILVGHDFSRTVCFQHFFKQMTVWSQANLYKNPIQ